MKLNINHIKKIENYIQNGQLEKALKFCDTIYDSNKNNLTLNKILAHIHGLMENYAKAIDVLERFENSHQNDFDIANNLGYYSLQSEKIIPAAYYISKAKELNSNAPAPYQNSAELNIIKRNFDQAEIDINRCIELNQKIYVDYDAYLRAIIIKSDILIAKKKIDDVVTLFLKYLEIKFNSEICLKLVEISHSSISLTLIETAKNLINNSSYVSHMDKFNKLVPIYFFLAYYYAKESQKTSEDYYIRANQEIFNIQRIRMIAFQKIFKKQIDTYGNIEKIKIEDQTRGKENIFIVGLPRSGTTLLESTISANKQVFAGGEMKAFNTLYNRISSEYESLDEVGLNKIGQAYLDVMNPIRGEFDFIVDKMPMNFTHIGFILKSLPSSKVFLMIRNPWDVAISLFKQRFVNNIPYASSFFNIGVYIANFEALTNFWLGHQNIKNKIYFIKYEDLVDDFNHHQKKIYDFCGVCSSYESSIREKHFARTRSMHQVQNKINRDSVRKKDFEGFHQEFMESYLSQREYWINNGIFFKNSYFGYLD